MAAPTAPTIETVSYGKTSITVRILAAATDGDGDLNETIVKYRVGSVSGAWSTSAFSANAVGTELTISGLTAGTLYVLISYADDVAGNESPDGTVLLVTTLSSDGPDVTASSGVRCPGHLIWNPTAGALGDFPYGGTFLGLAESGVLWGHGYEYAMDSSGEDGGPGPFDVAWLGDAPAMGVQLVAPWADAVKSALFPGLSKAGATGRYVIGPGDLAPGAWLAKDYSGRVLFAPIDEALDGFHLLRAGIPVHAREHDVEHGKGEMLRVLDVLFVPVADDDWSGAANEKAYVAHAYKGDVTV